MNTVYFHADDYGITSSQTNAILECHTNGILNSVSIMPNTDFLAESRKLLEDTSIRKVVHLNFIEGHSVASKEAVSLLTDEEGMLACSFGYFLKKSMLTGQARQQLKSQIKCEILAQIIAVCGEEKTICIDSHQHLHMVPIVLESLIEVIREHHYQLEELRIPVDPIFPLFSTPSLWKRVRLIDCIKWAVLKICVLLDHNLLKKLSFHAPCFFGIFFTCRMESDIVDTLLPKYQQYAAKKNRKLELMFHPGGIYSQDELLDSSQKDLVDFYQSPYRNKEAQTLKNLAM